jgi:hypothetical protein
MGSPTDDSAIVPSTTMDNQEKTESISPSMADLFIDPVAERKMMRKFDVSLKQVANGLMLHLTNSKVDLCHWHARSLLHDGQPRSWKSW